jgi:SAM-dependent methyltransferase
VLVERLGVEAVAACDPSPQFVTECAVRHPGVRVELGRAESIPFETGAFDHAIAQLVLHFVSDPLAAASEMMRVVRPGGWVSACVWDFDRGMEMLRRFWDAALDIDSAAPDEAAMRFGRAGEIAQLFESAGMNDVVESTLRVSSSYAGFDELWSGFLAGVGPAGAYCVSLSDGERQRLRTALFHRLGEPTGSFELGAVARCAVARTPRSRDRSR